MKKIIFLKLFFVSFSLSSCTFFTNGNCENTFCTKDIFGQYKVYGSCSNIPIRDCSEEQIKEITRSPEPAPSPTDVIFGPGGKITE